MSVSRRQFMEVAALGGLAAHAGLAADKDPKTGMPTRVLGRTGFRASILAFGGGSRFLAYKDEDKALQALNHALDAGVNYVDSAANYGNGQSEEWLGRFFKTRREGIFVVTKVGDRNGDKAMRTIEASLKRLQMSQVDLLHMHALGDEKDLAAIEAKDGVLNVLYRLREQKVARFIGVTCHADPNVLKTLLERQDLDCTQMALNAARVGSGANAPSQPLAESFEALALPVARQKNMGVTAMKIFGQDRLVGQAPADKLIKYALTLPVAAAVIGMPKFELLEENLKVAKSFEPLSVEEMRDLSGRLATLKKASLDRFFRDHIDA